MTEAAALARLLGQLSTTATFDSGRLHAIIDHETTELLVARVGGEMVGMATFVPRHCAEALETMTTMAADRGLRTLDLTSRPSRESALRLYEGVGFRRRETNILRYTPSEGPDLPAAVRSKVQHSTTVRLPFGHRLAALGYVKCGTMSEKGQHEMIRTL
jgi:hypothetical protein